VVEPYEQTLLELRMIDLYPAEVVNDLKKSFGSKFEKLSELERTLSITIYSDFCLSHQQLCSQITAHAREVTLPLVKLEKAGIISSTGEHKGKVYHKPNVVIPTPDNASGQFLAEYIFVNKPQISIAFEESPDLTPDAELNASKWKELEQVALVAKGNSRSISKDTINQVIVKLCSNRFITLIDLSALLNRKPDTLRKIYLNPLVAEEKLRLAYPTRRNHPKQAYTANIGEQG